MSNSDLFPRYSNAFSDSQLNGGTFLLRRIVEIPPPRSCADSAGMVAAATELNSLTTISATLADTTRFGKTITALLAFNYCILFSPHVDLNDPIFR